MLNLLLKWLVPKVWTSSPISLILSPPSSISSASSSLLPHPPHSLLPTHPRLPHLLSSLIHLTSLILSHISSPSSSPPPIPLILSPPPSPSSFLLSPHPHPLILSSLSPPIPLIFSPLPSPSSSLLPPHPHSLILSSPSPPISEQVSQLEEELKQKEVPPTEQVQDQQDGSMVPKELHQQQ